MAVAGARIFPFGIRDMRKTRHRPPAPCRQPTGTDRRAAGPSVRVVQETTFAQSTDDAPQKLAA